MGADRGALRLGLAALVAGESGAEAWQWVERRGRWENGVRVSRARGLMGKHGRSYMPVPLFALTLTQWPEG